MRSPQRDTKVQRCSIAWWIGLLALATITVTLGIDNSGTCNDSIRYLNADPPPAELVVPLQAARRMVEASVSADVVLGVCPTLPETPNVPPQNTDGRSTQRQDYMKRYFRPNYLQDCLKGKVGENQWILGKHIGKGGGGGYIREIQFSKNGTVYAVKGVKIPAIPEGADIPLDPFLFMCKELDVHIHTCQLGSHPNIVNLMTNPGDSKLAVWMQDYSEEFFGKTREESDDPKSLFIVMDLCEMNLNEALGNSGFVPSDRRPRGPDIWNVFGGVAKGLEHLHALKVIHRDLKLDNILLTQDPVTKRWNAKIADFGVSEIGETVREMFGVIAPELKNGGEGTSQVDAYALGSCLESINIIHASVGWENDDFLLAEALQIMLCVEDPGTRLSATELSRMIRERATAAQFTCLQGLEDSRHSPFDPQRIAILFNERLYEGPAIRSSLER